MTNPVADRPAGGPPQPPPSGPPPAPPPGLDRSLEARWPGRLIIASTALAWLALACLAAGVVLFLVPVTARVHSVAHDREITVQRCGTPVKFLLDGRSDQPAVRLDHQESAAYARNPCSAQVADQAVPGGALLLAGLVVGLVGLVLALVGHRAAGRRQVMAALAGGWRPPPPPAPVPLPGWGAPSTGAPSPDQPWESPPAPADRPTEPPADDR